MATVRDLRDRIRSLKNTQQITKAMKQVAAAKIRRAEMAQRQARPYAEAMFAMLHDLMDAVGVVNHPFLKPGTAADKGLAGAFNSNVIRLGEQVARNAGSVAWYAVGTKARSAVNRLSQTTGGFYVALSTGPKLDTARQVAARVTDDFAAGKISEILLVQSKLASMTVQRPESRTLIPIVAEKRETASGPRAEVEFAPSPEAVLTKLLPKYLEFSLFSAMLETDAAFFAAQLIAMSNATDNAGKLIDELTLQMNKARQAAITKEILEIVGGAEALAG
jgi:F-type H+-transporting ATPase subunit gamma